MSLREATGAPIVCRGGPPAAPALEVLPAREATIGPGQSVRRALPRRARRMVGAWCFLDRFGGGSAASGPEPSRAEASIGGAEASMDGVEASMDGVEASMDGVEPSMNVPPHPHIGIQTVTWLFGGEVLHRDSLGSEQTIRSGELNLMTSGAGIAHSEESRGAAARGLHGLQLWTALPEAARHATPTFAHHGELPEWREGAADVTLAIGRLAGRASPARAFSPIVGAELRFRGGETGVPVDPAFEHAIFVVSGGLTIDGASVPADALAYLGTGRAEARLSASAGSVAFLIGGEPFREEIVMWWNFVARSRAEIAVARRDWESGRRFGPVVGYPGPRVAAPELPAAG